MQYYTITHNVNKMKSLADSENWNFVNNVKLALTIVLLKVRKDVQEALLSQRGRAMLRVCIASIQNVERSLLLLVVSASDIPLRKIKLFSVLFSSVYSSMLHAVTNKHLLVRR